MKVELWGMVAGFPNIAVGKLRWLQLSVGASAKTPKFRPVARGAGWSDETARGLARFLAPQSPPFLSVVQCTSTSLASLSFR